MHLTGDLLLVTSPDRIRSNEQQDSHRSSEVQNTLAHLDILYGYAMVLTGNQGSSSDLIYETYKELPSVIRSVAGKEWADGQIKLALFAILRNRALASNLVRASPIAAIAAIDHKPTAIQAGFSRSRGPMKTPAKTDAHIRKALQQLPVELREALFLCQYGELSPADAAGILRCSVDEVAARTADARRRLCRLLFGSENR
jgi:RNA polymerase sigma-70 factor, ECF subfamily